MGWATAPSMPARLVCDALKTTITARQSEAGRIVHLDQGSQFGSAEFSRWCKYNGCVHLVLCLSKFRTHYRGESQDGPDTMNLKLRYLEDGKRFGSAA